MKKTSKYPMLDKLEELDEKNLLPDDDHPNRPDPPITKEELDQATAELIMFAHEMADKKAKK